MQFSLIKLGDICTITSSKRIFADEYQTSGIPFYRSREIIEKNANQTISEPLFISEETYQKIKQKFGVPNEGDLLLTSVGTLGIPYIVKNETFYFKDGNLTWFKDFNDDFNSKYLYYWLSSDFGHESLINRSIGSSQGAITIDILKKHKILAPCFKDQNSIVKILEKYDSLVQNISERVLILEDIIQSIYEEWFVRFKFPGFEHEEFNNGKPSHWEYKKFSEVCSYTRGVSYSSEEIENPDADCLLINLKNIRDYGGFRKENYKTYDGDFKNDQVVKNNDLVMAVTEMVQERRIIGYVGLVPSYNKQCVISADLIKINSQLNNLFLYCMFTYGGVSRCFSQYGNGTNVIHLKPSSIRNVKILIPDSRTINAFVEVVKDSFDLIEKLMLQKEILINQRSLLLPKLMSGKLNVSGKEIK